MREPHQSTVPLTGATVAEVFEHYLHQSEQIDSRFFLAATDTGAAGLYLQRLPTSEGSDPDGWPRVEALASTVRAEELLGLAPEALLTRLFHEEAVRVFEPRPIIHNFPQDWSKVRNMLLALGREEVYANVNEHGALIIHDELSNHRYRFTKPDIDTLFSHTPETPKSVH